jgi:hypothetical protein
VISITNVPINKQSQDTDFTIDAYCDLLKIAKENYIFASYDSIPWTDKFILWRHDCDYSLNRAYALACIESDHEVKATYFLNIHSEFYNLFERGQYQILKKIIAMGHKIGLHFDGSFYDNIDERNLSTLVRNEADLLENILDTKLSAFSFHNPQTSQMHCEDEKYGGLINCYSRRFKTQVPYCSDSNGYWRFRRLREILESASDPCLQILTHPEWWQEDAIPPRNRIFRSAYGRARFMMSNYDSAITNHGRENLSGAAANINFLRNILPDYIFILDFMWMNGEFDVLYSMLWRLHESQVNNLSKLALQREWAIPTKNLQYYFDNSSNSNDSFALFSLVFKTCWLDVSGINDETYQNLIRLRDQVIHGRVNISKQLLEDMCVILTLIIARVASWGKSQSINFDGLSSCNTDEIFASISMNDANLTP